MKSLGESMIMLLESFRCFLMLFWCLNAFEAHVQLVRIVMNCPFPPIVSNCGLSAKVSLGCRRCSGGLEQDASEKHQDGHQTWDSDVPYLSCVNARCFLSGHSQLYTMLTSYFGCRTFRILGKWMQKVHSAHNQQKICNMSGKTAAAEQSWPKVIQSVPASWALASFGWSKKRPPPF